MLRDKGVLMESRRLQEGTHSCRAMCKVNACVFVLRACGRLEKSLIVKMAAPNLQLFEI